MLNPIARPDRKFPAYLLLLVVLWAVCPRGLAQATEGSFIGRVTDHTGAVVVNAKVILTNKATGSTETQNTNKDGEYAFGSVQPGAYRIEITAPGFDKSILDNMNLDVAQVARQDVTLDVGNVNTTVIVDAVSPLIQTDSFSVGTVIDSNQIEEMPINGRQGTTSLLGLAAGVQQAGVYNLIAGNSGQGGANQSIDGVSINDILNARISDSVPSIDSIAQYVVITNNAPAEYGMGGAQILIQTKTGTNKFHGTVFEFNRSSALAARPYFVLPGAAEPPYGRNEVGFTFGGPLYRNKLFFFVSYEILDSTSSSTNLFPMPPAPFLVGDFSQYTSVTINGNPVATTIYDPLSPTRQPFPNNQIPADRMSAISQKLLKYYSCAGMPGNACVNIATPQGLGNNFSYSSPTHTVNPRWSARVDYQISAKDHLFVMYYPNNNDSSPGGENGTATFGNYHYIGNDIRHSTVGYTHIFRSAIVNDFAFGLYLFQNPRVDQNYDVDPPTLIPGLPATAPGRGLLPSVYISNLQQIYQFQSNNNAHQHSLQFYDNLSILRGRHTFKVGGQSIYDTETITNYNTGTFTFNGSYTGQPLVGKANATNPVNSFADFLLGDIVADTDYSGSASYGASLKTLGFYASDTWNATSKLTLSYGLRWDKKFPFQMTQGGLSTFDPSTGSLIVVTGTPDPTISSAYPFKYGSQVGYNLGNWIHLQNDNFEPRVGFAYRPFTGKNIVLRGGYGIFDVNLNMGDMVNNLANQYPFVLNNNYFSSTTGVVGLTFDNPFPTSGLSKGNPNIFAVARTYNTSYNQTLNLTVEAMVSKNTAIRASYLGNLGTRLFTPFPLNAYPLQPIGGPGQPASLQAPHPYQPWANITYYCSCESTNFHQLQLSGIRRFAGLTFNIQFQYTRALGEDGPNNYAPADKYDIRYDYGNLGNYAREAMVASYTWELPLGTGKQLFARAGRKTNLLISGWRFTGIFNTHTGSGFDVDYTESVVGTPGGRASHIPGMPFYPKNKTIKGWYNPSAFQDPILYTYSNMERNQLYGPGYFDWDSALFKQTPIGTRAKFEFRLETFNLLNHPNFNSPSGDALYFDNSVAAQITTSQGSSRTIQFGGRVSF